MNFRQTILINLFICSLLLSSCSNDTSIKVGLTTTLEDSGALSLLISQFKDKHKFDIKPVIAGSGQIHQLIERGDIDTAITHDPEGEATLLKKGLIQSRSPFVKNDFLIVGPAADPAHIKHSLTPDEAFKKIANAKSLYISRGDNSGTHQMEKRWLNKSKNSANNLKMITTGTGMGATLTIAADKEGYTLVDRGTWLNFNNKKTLVPLFEDSELLLNVYSVLSLTKQSSKKEAVAVWEKWLLTNEAKEILENYRINNQPVFLK